MNPIQQRPLWGFFTLLCLAGTSVHGAETRVRGFSLTELGSHKYDALDDVTATVGKKEAQLVVDELYKLGVRQINLSPRATMSDPWRSELVPVTPLEERTDEAKRYIRLARYIHSKGMKVGLRPIFFVVNSSGGTPYVQEFPAPYGALLEAAAKALDGFRPATVATVSDSAAARLEELLKLVGPAKDGSGSWLVRRVTKLRERVEALKTLDPKSAAAEASRIASKARFIGSKKDWWHGNIEPVFAHKWFESFKTYIDVYLPIAKIAKVEEFTLGAELYSMTVGIEDRWDEAPHGFPAEWLALLNYVRPRLPKGCRVMYDINFTDDRIAAGGLEQYGGEFARWKYRLVDLADTREHKESWQNLVDFWKGLDAIGIDMYRSLLDPQEKAPENYDELVDVLQQTATRYATQINNALFEIENTSGIEQHKVIVLKEIGYRSVNKGFVNPFVYAGNSGTLNLDHQGAAYEAILRSFWDKKLDWFDGIVFWDASVDRSKHGPKDIGFSIIDKEKASKAVQERFRD